MIVISGYVDLQSAEELTRLSDDGKTMVEATRLEEGCIEYGFAIDMVNPCRMRIYETWADQAALDAHMASPHMAEFNKAIAGAKLAGANVLAYPASEPKKLI
ncbi:MAG: antibiotic biosynthesis monooxygenase [Robiginitomaculum sp.]|nr:MAG: antibiotic biosynthesis monooxygenase [Robiginitomaculum sp.]